jgi:hypothetical protein
MGSATSAPITARMVASVAGYRIGFTGHLRDVLATAAGGLGPELKGRVLLAV